MKRLSFRITALLLLLSWVVGAQTKTIYKKSIGTKANTTLNIKVTNLPITFEESQDDQLHFDFQLEFKNYSAREVQEIIDKIDIKTLTRENIIEYDVRSEDAISHSHYTLNSKEDNGFFIDLDDLNLGLGKKKKKVNQYKSRDSLLQEIRASETSQGSLFDMMKVLTKDGKKKKIDTKTIQVLKAKFTVKIPTHVRLNLKGEEAQVFMEDDFNQHVDISLKKGMFRAKQINNERSSINVEDLSFTAENLSIERLKLKDVSRALIGSLEKADCRFMGSRAELGYLGKGVNIQDYNSKIFFYNFDQKFEELLFKGEYTDLFVYDIENKVKIKAKGNITLKFDESNAVSRASNIGVKPQMTTTSLEKNVDEDSYGKVEVNLESGVLHVISGKKKKS